MSSPQIDVDTLPGLETSHGLFGSLTQNSANYDDRVVDVMVYVYNVLPPELLG